MFFAWALPVYRQPVWLETFIDDPLHYVQDEFINLLNGNKMVAKLLTLPCRNHISAFTITIIVSVLWILFSYFQTWNTRRNAGKVASSLSPSSSLKPRRKYNKSTVNKPIHSLANPLTATPKGHSHGATPASSSSAVSTHAASGLGNRTGRISTPGYQTPVVNTSKLSKKNFSHLQRTAPVTYATLRKEGVLDADGTPVKRTSRESSVGTGSM